MFKQPKSCIKMVALMLLHSSTYHKLLKKIWIYTSRHLIINMKRGDKNIFNGKRATDIYYSHSDIWLNSEL